MSPRYIAEWDENTDISWWNAGRKRLNKVIQAFNDWQRKAQIEGSFDPRAARELLAFIEEGRQTWAAVDGGSGWLEVLEEMESVVTKLLGLPFKSEVLPDGGLRIKGDDLDEALRVRALSRGWIKEGGGWRHPDGGILPFL